MSGFPMHFAADDEPIPALSGRPWDGPDLAAARPLKQMLAELRAQDSDWFAYIEQWRADVASLGGSILAQYDEDGSVHLMMGSRCDTQIRHRSRWLDELSGDLDRIDGRRDFLLATLTRGGIFIDHRPKNAAATTVALRNYLRTGGRILINPEGKLTQGGTVPRAFIDGSPEAKAEWAAAERAYFAARHHRLAIPQIRRAVRMLGTTTSGGWMVLETRP